MKPKLYSVILEAKDMQGLADFYSKLLDWPIVYTEDEFIRLECPETGMGIAIQYAEDYIPPVWPSRTGFQQMMVHLDFMTANKQEREKTVSKALSLGAKTAKTQYGGDEWTTMLDPAGHPFCFLSWK